MKDASEHGTGNLKCQSYLFTLKVISIYMHTFIYAYIYMYVYIFHFSTMFLSMSLTSEHRTSHQTTASFPSLCDFTIEIQLSSCFSRKKSRASPGDERICTAPLMFRLPGVGTRQYVGWLTTPMTYCSLERMESSDLVTRQIVFISSSMTCTRLPPEVLQCPQSARTSFRLKCDVSLALLVGMFNSGLLGVKS